MKYLEKLPLLATVFTLTGCSPTPAPQSSAIVNGTRYNLETALSGLDTVKTGIQTGKNPQKIYSVECQNFASSLTSDVGLDAAKDKAANNLIEYACPSVTTAGKHQNFVPILQEGSSVSGHTACYKVATVKMAVCDGNSVDLKDPK